MNIDPKIKQIKPSATLAINELSQQLVAKGKKVYRLGFGQSPFPVPGEVINALQENAFRKDYLPVRGLVDLREAVADFNTRTLGIKTFGNQVLIGPGSKELIYDLLLATDASLLLPSPSWVSYEPQAILAGKAAHWLETTSKDNWCLTAKQLEENCEQIKGPKVLILNYPNNPTGTTYSKENLAALSVVAAKHQLLIVADEIYGEVHHQGKHQSIACYYPEGTIISAGLSKWCGAGGWRLGTFTFPKTQLHLLDAMAVIASETFTSVSTPIQWAAVTAFQGSPAITQYVLDSRRILGVIANYVHQRLTAMHLSMPVAQGGFYLFPDFEYYREAFAKHSVVSSSTLCELLLQQVGIALLPGVAFGRPTTELTTRLSFVDFDGARALEALAQTPNLVLDEVFLEEYCPLIVEGMEVLEAFLSRL